MPAIAPLIPLLGLGALVLGGLRQNRQQQQARADGTAEPTLGEQIPQAPDIQGDANTPAPGESGQALTEEQRATEERRLAAEQEDQARANELAGDVRQSRDETTAAIDEQRAQLGEDQARLQENIQQQGEQLQQIPDTINSEFERLRQEFDTQASTAFDRVDSQREAALGQVMQGQSLAMQSAVQGIQGNVNNQVAQIMANPNLSDAQKQSMVAQVRLNGASALAPAVGQTVLQFNQLAADTATKFGAITGQIQTQVLSEQGRLVGMQGEAFANAQIQVGQMTNQLLEIDANTSVAFANAQGQLLNMRTQAEMMSNDVLLRLLPEQSTPYADFTGSAATQYQVSNDIIKGQFAMDLQSYGMQLQLAMLQSMQGNPMANLFMGAMQGFAMGGMPGALFGAAGGYFGSQGPQI